MLKSSGDIHNYMSESLSADEAVALSRADLAKKLSMDPDLVDVLVVEPCTWGDASMGLPEVGMSYAQMVVEGYRVVLRAAGGTFEYRLGGGIMKMR